MKEHFPYAVAAVISALWCAEHYAAAVMASSVAVALIPSIYGNQRTHPETKRTRGARDGE